MAKRGVQMVCSYMPETIAEKCEQFVDEYGDEIVELIINTELDPKVFCTELALCSPTQGRFIDRISPRYCIYFWLILVH